MNESIELSKDNELTDIIKSTEIIISREVIETTEINEDNITNEKNKTTEINELSEKILTTEIKGDNDSSEIIETSEINEDNELSEIIETIKIKKNNDSSEIIETTKINEDNISSEIFNKLPEKIIDNKEIIDSTEKNVVKNYCQNNKKIKDEKGVCICDNDNGYYSIKYKDFVDDSECFNNETKPEKFYLNKESKFYEICHTNCLTCNNHGNDEENN